MAKTEEEIRKDLIANVKAIDPTIQTQFGPVRDMLIDPLPAEFASIAADTERLVNIYKLEFLEQFGTDEEIEAYQNNFALEIGSGRKSEGTQIFFRNEAPTAGEIITIPVGALVSNADRSSIYKVTEEAIMDGDFASTFFNATERRYEVSAKTEALNIGEVNNLPIGRVTLLLTLVNGILGTINTLSYKKGEDTDSSAVQFSRVQARFKGLNLGSPNGVETAVKEFDPALVTDVHAVQPHQRDIFQRFVTTPALDVYVIGSDTQDAEDNFTAVGGETALTLSNVPATTITAVTKNGETQTVTFQPDTTELGGSTRALDQIVFDAALTAGDVVNIKYTFNKLISDIKNNITGDTFDDSLMFETDILVLEGASKLVTIQYSFSTFSSAERDTVNTAITTELENLVTLETFVSSVRPIDVQTAVINNVVGLSRFVIEKFQATTGGLVEIETIFFKDNERSVLDTANLSVVGV